MEENINLFSNAVSLLLFVLPGTPINLLVTWIFVALSRKYDT
jgi:hypothetical protein